ncbi:MAG TPA: aromatic amino acid transport family protein [Candidatus Paceibacterota bacterium]|nr:aromatic amino acid transport family protein [Candidatus Paceibacterota bacterium]HOL53770.1 aromatic amino acid transport family protein [Candidatus Paceibacterota bacterium]HON21705.1 aromatic amino acid transport family protein [Candidatus Paceibacterota bacterium]HOV88477.1 aromatic amino acid transport family protein [Candidatus Paceibacterota bacterium]HPP16830.1 aromatic amino acid transport family protein [Candidatus Paceibacterota bacterium]
MSLSKKISNYFTTSSILAGTILGAGLFTLPYIFIQSGSLLFIIYLILVTLICLATHLAYGESLLRTEGEHRFIGMAEIYLGKWAKKLITVTTFISIGGCLLAYLIMGGQFLQNFSQIINHPLNQWQSVLIFWLLGSIGTILGIKFVGGGEMISLLVITAFIIVFAILGIPHLNLSSVPLINFSQFLLPYGVLLFALSGASAVPEIYSYFRKQSITPKEINFKKPILWGTIIPAILYLIFCLGAVGIMGPHNISIDLVPQLVNINPWLGIITDLLGILLIITSYFILALNFKNSLVFDLNLKNLVAWTVSIFLPLILYQLGIHNFIQIIGFLGAAVLGIESLITFLIHKQSQQKGTVQPLFVLKISPAIRIILIALLILGAVLEILGIVV